MFKRALPFIVTIALISPCSSGLYAGQHSTVGLSTDVTSGGSRPILSGSSGTDNNYVASFGSYPTLDFTTLGQHTSFQSSYSFGFNRDLSSSHGKTESHAASSRLSARLGPKWNINLSDTFEQSTNSSTFKLFRGDTSIPEDFLFIFDPLNADKRRTFTASAAMDRRLTDRSTLTFGGSYSVLEYIDASQFSGILSNQQRETVNMGYGHSLERGGWSLGVSASQFDFDLFHKARSYAVDAGYSRQLTKNLSMHLNGGPSYVQSPEVIKNRVGANGSIGLQRAVKAGNFSVSYSQSAADSSGLGSIAGTKQAWLGMTHAFGRKMTASADISGFDTRGKTVAATSSRGGSVGGSVGFSVARMWSMNFGGQYQKYTGNSQFALDQSRLFVSLRFHNPELWRF